MSNNLEGLTEDEIEHIKKHIGKPKINNNHTHDFGSKHIKIGLMSDTHIGSKVFDYKLFDMAVKFFNKEKPSAIYHAGDILEGMSGRPGHIYELDAIGMSAQLNLATELFKQINIPTYFITGNHDAWAKQKGDMGLEVGPELDNRVKNLHYLGSMEADVKLHSNVTMKLFHANDGSAYASSYKLQKLVESLDGGKKPDMLVSGHYHKALYMFIRNVHAYEAGCIQAQSEFMRSKKLAAHRGFYQVELWFGRNGIQRLKNEFVPGY